ncbi:hypothetical protein NDU88_000812 [Pleurodeles waltl]|uniref:Uncharacterized protein n=1 Tax=Pleurodeles waltl TaxID=8319 RepID=A0AAV7MIR7_PLEWA|nr:hypothetical protein NDU88_000812 [Pleurodeles waltl]
MAAIDQRYASPGARLNCGLHPALNVMAEQLLLPRALLANGASSRPPRARVTGLATLGARARPGEMEPSGSAPSAAPGPAPGLVLMYVDFIPDE